MLHLHYAHKFKIKFFLSREGKSKRFVQQKVTSFPSSLPLPGDGWEGVLGTRLRKLDVINILIINNKIPKSDWLSTTLISALIGQYASCLSKWTVCSITSALNWPFFTVGKKKILEFLVFWLKKELLFSLKRVLHTFTRPILPTKKT